MSTHATRWPRVNDGDGCVSLGMMTNLRPGADRHDELRLTGAFYREEGDEPFAVLGWGCESTLDGFTERASHDYYATFEDLRRYSPEDAAYEVAGYAAEKIGVKADEKLTPEMVRDVAAREMRAALALNPEAPAWVLAWAGLTEADAAAFRCKPVKVAAEAAEKKPRAKKPRAAKVESGAEFIASLNADRFDAPAKADEDEAVPAAETSPSPVKCVEPASQSVELPAKCVELAQARFRGVLLRSAAEWEDHNAEGVFFGVTNERYHACPSLSGTRAAKFAKSAAHGIIEKVIPARSRDLGILVHGDALEGKDASALGFAVVPGKTTTKEGCVTEDMVRLSRNCCAAMRGDANTAGVLAAKGMRELSCRVRCPDTGAMLRCRFDLAPEAGAWAWDVKTTSADGPDAFEGSFGEFGYAVTAAHYLRVAALVGLPFRAMAYACVSTEEPHEVWVVKFGPLEDCAEAFALANAASITSARRYVHGRATGEHPKRTHAPRVARLKPWHLDAMREAANSEIPY